jgi:hypothetical protein
MQKPAWQSATSARLRRQLEIKTGARAPSLGFRKCVRCSQSYAVVTRKDRYCEACKSGNGPPGPLCRCGCGDTVGWQRAKLAWSIYRPGHIAKINPHGLAKNRKLRGSTWGTRAKTRPVRTCERCGANYQKANRLYCSKTCSLLVIGERRLMNGYVSVKIGNAKWRFEHQLVAEQMLGRSLHAGEIPHHKNKKRDDNRPENIFVFHCQKCHLSHHGRNRPLRYSYADVHDPEFPGVSISKRPRPPVRKTCISCNKKGAVICRGNEKRCVDCREGNGPAPACKCGCGKTTNWSYTTNGFARFCAGHGCRKYHQVTGKPLRPSI